MWRLAHSVNADLSSEPAASLNTTGSASSAVAVNVQPLSDRNAIMAATAARLLPSTNGWFLQMWNAYAAAKWAERGFLHTLRIELQAERSPVTVSMVHPGSIDTPVWTTTHSAIGRMPRKPPEGYHPSVIARALVGMAREPRAEMTIGAEAKALELLWESSRPLGDLMMRMIHHYYMSGRKPMGDVNALWEAAGRGIADGGLIGRPSLTLPLRLATLPLRLVRG